MNAHVEKSKSTLQSIPVEEIIASAQKPPDVEKRKEKKTVNIVKEVTPKPKAVLSFCKIKQWYFPVDAETYKSLRDTLKIPATRIHQNLLPVIEMMAKKYKMVGRNVDFNADILNPYLDKLGAVWLKKEFRICTLNTKILKFETTSSKVKADAKLTIDKIEASLRRFFDRWGYRAYFSYSESRGKCKLHVTYKFDHTKLPVIPLVEPNEALPTIRFKIGFVRLTLIMSTKRVEVNYSVAAGSGWTSMHTSSCLYSQIGDVRPMLRALIDIKNREPDNDAISNDN